MKLKILIFDPMGVSSDRLLNPCTAVLLVVFLLMRQDVSGAACLSLSHTWSQPSLQSVLTLPCGRKTQGAGGACCSWPGHCFRALQWTRLGNTCLDNCFLSRMS